MAIIKCKMCGGDLNIAENVTVAECEYCGTKQTVPVVDDEKKIKLYERANKLRINCEFDKAAGVYENIVSDYEDEAEGYWGLILCRYGIEYVDDPITGKKVPTCHRSSFDSIMDDSDFEMVMENSDAVSRLVYREEAKYIEEIRKGIIEVSGKEEPYDIFICYKETDVNGERTLDSVLAQDVYDALIEKGYRVFFSRVTLEDKLGVEYEPYIFAALNSAKIMLAFGTSYDHYNAVWVKNEWSRYLKLMAQDKTRHLIPCFKNVDAYDIPKEFAKLQAQDMGKVGAIQDLLRGIQKISAPEAQTNAVTVKETVIVNVAPLLKRAFMFLEDGDWERADDFCEQALNQDPENAEAYLGKLMAELHVKKQDRLEDQAEPFDNSNNYQKAVRFADEKLKTALSGYIMHIKNVRLDGSYTRAKNAMSAANTESAYKEAAKFFEAISEYKDSSILAKECYKKAEEEKKRVEEEKKKCDVLFKEYRTAVQNEKSIIEKKEKANKSLSSLNTTYNNLVNIKNNWQSIENDLFSLNERVKSIQSEIASWNNERSNLGFFAGKRKREIAETIDSLESKQQSITSEITSTQKKKQGYSNISELDNTINGILKQIDEQKEIIEKLSGTVSWRTIRDELRQYEYGKDLLSPYRKAKVGEFITFGKYEQDNNAYNGKEDIEWLVLEVKDSKKLVISKYVLDNKPYNTSRADVTWETSTLRRWLNGDFINSAFSVYEKAMILTTTVSADRNSSFTTNPGRATHDQVFLLSSAEAEKYLGRGWHKTKYIKPTNYAASKGMRVDNGTGGCEWWLRSPGQTQACADTVYPCGGCSAYGRNVEMDSGVCPALWLDLNP